MDPSLKILLKRAEGVVVNPGAALQVPISFSPLVHQEHAGELQVSYDPGLDEDDVLIWRYPVRGLAEVQHMGVLYRFNGKARVPMDEEVQVQLPGLGRLRDGETFSHELEIAGEGGAALAKAIKVVPVKTVLHSPTDKLVYRMQLTPAAAISRNVTFIVRMASGGRWRFDVRLEVAPPDVVDTIEIETTVGQIKSAPVWLFSPSATEPMPFTGESLLRVPICGRLCARVMSCRSVQSFRILDLWGSVATHVLNARQFTIYKLGFLSQWVLWASCSHASAA